MLFYKMTGTISDQCEIADRESRAKRQAFKREIQLAGESFNEKPNMKSFYFLSELTGGKAFLGAICPDSSFSRKEMNDFLQAIKLDLKDIKIEETIFETISSLLTQSSREDFISDDDEILEKYELGEIEELSHFRSWGFDYQETVLETESQASAEKRVKRYLTHESLEEELERIKKGSLNAKVSGHPVHYIIEADDKESMIETRTVLLNALYANKRILNRRYCEISFKEREQFMSHGFEAVCKMSKGGTIVVPFGRSFEEGSENGERFARGNEEIIQQVCENVKKYRNDVLMIFCLPKECSKLKTLLYDNLDTVTLVEIEEKHASNKQAKGFLRTLCRENHISPSEDLYSRIDIDRGYLTQELRSIFGEWFDRKLKVEVFPQYAAIDSTKAAAVKARAKGSAYEELQSMVGLSKAKDVIQKALNYYKVMKLYREQGIPQDRPALHMVFTGNPGTAKTTAARLFAEIMKDNGLLSKGHLVEVGRADLVGKYVGWTANIVKERFREANGGVLFIDEAYSLVEDKAGLYGDEAINTIVQEMENNRENMVVIFAGYPKEMEDFLNKNPGLRSRIAFHVPFEDYSAEELCEIAKLMSERKGNELTEGAILKLSEHFEKARRLPDFGNGRYVRNVLEQARMNHATHVLEMEFDKITPQILSLIDENDLDLTTPKENNAIQIGFAC